MKYGDVEGTSNISQEVLISQRIEEGWICILYKEEL